MQQNLMTTHLFAVAVDSVMVQSAMSIAVGLASLIQMNIHPKFFHEVGHGMDRRYYRGTISLQKKHVALRTVLADVTLIDAQWVIVYGSLLGWVHTGDVLPWDDDIDLALFSAKDVSTLRAAHGRVINNTYIEVNPFSVERSKADTDNQIDARAISLLTGVYIDILFPTRYGNQYKIKSGRTIRATDVHPVKAAAFAGSHVHVPNHYFNFLQHAYGCVHPTAVKPVTLVRKQC